MAAISADRRLERRPRSRRPPDVDPDTRAASPRCGYVGTFVATPAAERSQLADPKDKIDLFNLVINAREQIHDEHDPDRGLQALAPGGRQDPQVVGRLAHDGERVLRAAASSPARSTPFSARWR